VRKNRRFLHLFIAALFVATVAHAQSRKKSPTSKLYVADTVGDSQIDTGTEIDDLTKKSVYNAEGTTIETKVNSNASIVLSNGTGLYFDVDTRVQIKAFEQEALGPTAATSRTSRPFRAPRSTSTTGSSGSPRASSSPAARWSTRPRSPRPTSAGARP